MEQSVLQLRAWEDAGHHGLQMAVNVPPSVFESEGVDRFLLDLLAQHEIAGNQIELELTERTLTDASPSVIERLQSLRRHGISVAIDDFGTGYSNLSYLTRLPLDCLKIDLSFVQGATTEPVGRDGGANDLRARARPQAARRGRRHRDRRPAAVLLQPALRAGAGLLLRAAAGSRRRRACMLQSGRVFQQASAARRRTRATCCCSTTSPTSCARCAACSARRPGRCTPPTRPTRPSSCWRATRSAW